VDSVWNNCCLECLEILWAVHCCIVQLWVSSMSPKLVKIGCQLVDPPFLRQWTQCSLPSHFQFALVGYTLRHQKHPKTGLTIYVSLCFTMFHYVSLTCFHYLPLKIIKDPLWWKRWIRAIALSSLNESDLGGFGFSKGDF
jgi:hypothetical protein